MTSRIVRFGVFELDLGVGELRRAGALVRIAPQPARALAMLVERAGEVVSREEIRQRLWPEGTHVDFEGGLNSCVRQIRAALGDQAESPRYVQTLPKRGYRFLPPVRVSPPAPEIAEARAVSRRRPGLTAAAVLAALAAAGFAVISAARKPPERLRVAVLPFDLQRLVALDITRSLTRELLPGSATPAAAGDAAALEAYLRGRQLLARGTDGELRQALELFGEARSRDPGDARACAAEAEALYLMGAYGLLSPAEASRRGSEAALAALVRDPGLAEAHAILGRIRHRFDKDLPGAQVALERALALNPSSAAAHQWNAHQLDEAGRPREALAAIRRAHELDPRSLGINADLASLLHEAGRRAEAEARFRETLGLDPAFTKARYLRGLAYEREGRHREALAEFRRARSADPRTPKFLAALGRAQSRVGDGGAALGSLAELRSLAATRYVSAELLDGLAELVEGRRAAAPSSR